MTQLLARPYAGATDLQRMETALAQGYASTSLRVGDLSWLSREHSHRELSLDIRLWEDANGELLAWTYFRPNGEFNAFVMPDTGLAENDALFDAMLKFVHDAAQTSVAMGDPPVTLVTYAVAPSRSAEDRALAAALERSGYRIDRSPTADSGVLSRPLDDIPEPALPHGYRLDWVATPAHVVGRVEAHRAAFAPSDLSVRKYQRVQRTWAYRPTLDRIALTDAGEVVAFCTAWLDEHNAAGLLEPVGTHPAHRQRGLAAAVCTDAIRALRDAGARTAQVGYNTEAGYATYRSVGFDRKTDELTFYREHTT